MAKAAKSSGLASVVDDKQYEVKITRAVMVGNRIRWIPGLLILASGAFIKEMDAKHEGLIESVSEVV